MVSFNKFNHFNFFQLSTDLEFLIGINKTLRYLSLKPNVPVHVYLFTFEGQLGYLKGFIKLTVKNLPKGKINYV